MSLGLWAVLPPLVSVVLAVRYKDVLFALFGGVAVGSVLAHRGDLVVAVPSIFKDVLFVEVAKHEHAAMLVMMTFIGGFVAVITQSGGAEALAERASSFVKTRCTTQLAAWACGISIFFSDSANPLLLGPIFQPIADKMRVSREKMAWIIDSTASPVCVLVPIIGWGIYVQSLVANQLTELGLQQSAFDTFLAAIPFQFYALGTLLMVPLIAFLGFEFSAMYEAEQRTVDTGQPYWPEARPLRTTETMTSNNDGAPTVSMIVIPLFVLFVTLFGLLAPSGFPFVPVPGDVLWSTLSAGYLLGAVVCMALMVRHGIKTAKEAFSIYVGGMKDMGHILMILVLAWSLGAVCKTVGTDVFIVGMCKDTVPVFCIPALLFLTGSAISFATGSAWGTFAILIPIAMPLGHKVGIDIPIVLGAVLSGGLFGDHCSPISDTTIMSSMGAACDHIDHVKTQVPYACCVGGASLVGYLLAGLTGSVLCLLVSVTILCALVCMLGRMWGKRLTC